MNGANQAKYLHAIATHDINFGIGPAGGQGRLDLERRAILGCDATPSASRTRIG